MDRFINPSNAERNFRGWATVLLASIWRHRLSIPRPHILDCWLAFVLPHTVETVEIPEEMENLLDARLGQPHFHVRYLDPGPSTLPIPLAIRPHRHLEDEFQPHRNLHGHPHLVQCAALVSEEVSYRGDAPTVATDARNDRAAQQKRAAEIQ